MDTLRRIKQVISDTKLKSFEDGLDKGYDLGYKEGYKEGLKMFLGGKDEEVYSGTLH